MNKIDILYQKWQSLQPLPERKQYLLSQRFTVDYNYNSNHIEGNTLTYGQTELLLLFGKVSGEGDLKDFNDMKASQVSLKMIEEEAKNLNMPLTETFIRQLHKTLLREDYEPTTRWNTNKLYCSCRTIQDPTKQCKDSLRRLF